MSALKWIIPFRYFIVTRIASRSAMIAWLLTYVAPVVLLACISSPMTLIYSIIACALLVILVYVTYEYGYLFNDTMTVSFESNPTLRIGEVERGAITLALPTIFYWRIAVTIFSTLCFCFLVIAAGLGAFKAFISAGFLGGSILCIYWIYNRIRGRVTIGLFLLLVGLRFGGPITVIAWLGEIDLSVLAVVLLLYPLPNTIEFAGKCRFGIRFLAFIPRYVDFWRVVYYCVLCILIYGFYPVGGLGGKILMVGSVYFLVYRVLILVASSVVERSVSPPRN